MGKDLNKKDILVITGDAGFVWNYGREAKGEEHYWREWISNKPWTTFCVLGNHEAYPLIEQFPIVNFGDSLVHQITNSLYYAISGNIYNLCGQRSLIINGADSHDKEFRIEGVSWWNDEQITEDDVDKALFNLRRYDNKVDNIFSHTGGSEICNFLGFKPTISDIRLDKILKQTEYKQMYCGHYHCDKIINSSQRIMYNDIILINSYGDETYII